MIAAAVGLTACLLLLVLVVPARLTRASWTLRSPALALLLWQAVGLAGGLLAIEAAATLALSAAGPTHLGAVGALGGLDRLPLWAGAAMAVAVLVLLRLLAVLLAAAAVTLRARRDHRQLVDLVSTRNPLLADAVVVEHDVPVAYCLPGLRPRVVLSRAVLSLLHDDELRAVLAHEAAHVEQRHDLVVLPFVALRSTFPWLRGVRTAVSSVALLVELLADDLAARRHRREVLARALYKVGSGAAPAGGLAAGGADVLLRARRMLDAPEPLPVRQRLAVVGATVGVLALPPVGLLLPLLASR